MKIGVCTGTNIERMKLARDIGYDFVESHCQEICNLSEKELDDIKNAGIPVFSANCFIGMRVVGEERNDEKIAEYLDTLFARASYLGMQILVFGSSGARNRPEGASYEETVSQIVSFLKNLVAPRAEKYGIRVAIEPLRKAECNIINLVSEGVEIAKLVESEYVKVLADVKHVVEGGEDLASLASYGDMLIHAHTSNPFPDESTGKKRTFPRQEDSFDQASFLLPLAKAGVRQVAIEADVIDFESDCRAAYEVLKQYR